MKDEEILHKKSLVLARFFKNNYEAFGKEHPVTQRLLSEYVSTRREIPGEYDRDKGFSTRFGAREARREISKK